MKSCERMSESSCLCSSFFMSLSGVCARLAHASWADGCHSDRDPAIVACQRALTGVKSSGLAATGGCAVSPAEFAGGLLSRVKRDRFRRSVALKRIESCRYCGREWARGDVSARSRSAQRRLNSSESLLNCVGRLLNRRDMGREIRRAAPSAHDNHPNVACIGVDVADDRLGPATSPEGSLALRLGSPTTASRGAVGPSGTRCNQGRTLDNSSLAPPPTNGGISSRLSDRCRGDRGSPRR